VQMMPLRAFRASDEVDVRNIQPCFGLSGQIKDNSNKVPDSRYYAYSAMCEGHTDEAQTSEENFAANGIFLDSNEDVRNQPCFGLSGWIEDKSDEVPDDSRYAHSAMCEGSTDEVHTSEEFAADGITSALKTKHCFSHSDEVVLDWPPAAAAGIEDKILCKLRHKKAVEQEKGATELRNLTREVVDYQITLCTPAVLTALVQLLQQSKHAGVLSNATAAIMNLSLPNQNKVKIVSAGAIPHIVEVLKSNAQDAHIHAAGVLFSLVLNDEIRETDRFLHAIPPLIDLLKSEPLEAQHDAAMALYHLSSSQINRTKLIQAGGVAILLSVVEGDSSILARIALLTLSRLAAVTEGHNAICEANGVKELVNILALRSLPPPLGPVDDDAAVKGLNDWASVREHAAAVLLQLSHQNSQFKIQALDAGIIRPLQKLVEHGTKRAKRKAVALLQKIE
jgi:HEAT repeat protein